MDFGTSVITSDGTLAIPQIRPHLPRPATILTVKVHGIDLWPFWMDEIEGNAEFVQKYSDIGKKYYNAEILPSDMGYTWYVGIKAIVAAAREAENLTPEGMTKALENVHFSTLYGDDLYFRDFDHQMAHAYYYVTAVEDHTGKWSIPVGEIYEVYEGEEMLPTKEEVRTLTVFDHNQEAIRLYEKLGFKIEETVEAPKLKYVMRRQRTSYEGDKQS